MTKICFACKKEKDLSEFYKEKAKKDGHRHNCIQCARERNKVWRENNKEAIIERSKRYYKNNREALIEKNKKYYADNREAVRERMKKYRKKNIEIIREKERRYNRDNKEVRYKKHKKWAKNNKEYTKKYSKNYRSVNKEKIERYKKSPASFDTYATQLAPMEEVRRDPNNTNTVQCKCTLCKRWFSPKTIDIVTRIQALKGNHEGECRIYCSEKCKQGCTIFNRSAYPKDYRFYTSRPLQAEWRKMVLERDEYTCQRCGDTEGLLIAHHFEGIEINPIESADIDMGVTLCEDCNAWVHAQEGCTPKEMQRVTC